MSFRNDYFRSYEHLVDEKLQATLDSGFSGVQTSGKALLKAVQRGFSNFDQALQRVPSADMSFIGTEFDTLARDLGSHLDDVKSEIREQGQSQVYATNLWGSRVEQAIYESTFILGHNLDNIRWSLEQIWTDTREIVELLRDSLGNESYQYYEQGVDCFEKREFQIAHERFEKALEADRTNHLAYQYLGLISIELDDSASAFRNLELARKFAPDGNQKASALNHLARCHHAAGSTEKSESLMIEATSVLPEAAWVWYERAIYHTQMNKPEAACEALEEAFWCDCKCWARAAMDSAFHPIRTEVLALLERHKLRYNDWLRRNIELLSETIALAEKESLILPSQSVHAYGQPSHPIHVFCQQASTILAESDDLYIWRNTAIEIRKKLRDFVSEISKDLDHKIQDRQRLLDANQKKSSEIDRERRVKHAELENWRPSRAVALRGKFNEYEKRREKDADKAGSDENSRGKGWSVLAGIVAAFVFFYAIIANFASKKSANRMTDGDLFTIWGVTLVGGFAAWLIARWLSRKNNISKAISGASDWSSKDLHQFLRRETLMPTPEMSEIRDFCKAETESQATAISDRWLSSAETSIENEKKKHLAAHQERMLPVAKEKESLEGQLDTCRQIKERFTSIVFPNI